MLVLTYKTGAQAYTTLKKKLYKPDMLLPDL